MKFQCFVCDNENPCSLIVKYIGDVPPTLCPFNTEKMAIANWKKELPKGAQNTEQQVQADSQASSLT